MGNLAMRTKLYLLSVILFAAVLISAATSYRVPVWDGARYTWPLLGKGLVVQGGYLDVILPASLPPRQRNVLVPWDPAASGYRFPVVPKNEECYINGYRYRPTGNYEIKADLLIPGTAGNWPPGPEAEVVCDYDP